MAAWFAMLVLLVSILLLSAINITKPEWAAGYLVIFATVLIVMVLGCVTLMLTLFRPHLQDGKEYAQWLKDKNTYSSGVIRREQVASTTRVHQTAKKLRAEKISKSSISISITNAPGADMLIENLSRAGFSPEIYREPLSGENDLNNLERHESIWVGCKLPAKEAIEAIKIAVSLWPHLKYMHLSNDGGAPPEEVHYQMYFGGATSTAESYNLVAWSNEEMLALGRNLSQESFHLAIRSKYS